MRAINATPVRIAGLATLCLAAGALGGVSGALLVDALADDAPAAPRTVEVTPTPDASERLRLSLAEALESVVTILVDLPPGQTASGQPTERQNFGTGVVITADGLVLTNQHVVEGATRIRVVLPTGEERDATLVADDAPFHDVALLQTDGRGLRTARLGDSSTAGVGDPVAVVASGVATFDNQAKVGVVSAADVAFPREGVILEGLLQTDASVNNGDSGGALVSADGEVIGLVTFVVRTNANGQEVQGVAMAHAINDLKPFIEAVSATGVNPRGRIGIERLGRHHVPLTPALAAERGLPMSDGALVVDVEAESPAALAGIAAGDVVLAVDGVAVAGLSPLPNLLASAQAGDRVTLSVWRDGQVRDVALEPLPVRAAVRSSG